MRLREIIFPVGENILSISTRTKKVHQDLPVIFTISSLLRSDTRPGQGAMTDCAVHATTDLRSRHQSSLGFATEPRSGDRSEARRGIGVRAVTAATGRGTHNEARHCAH
jgi:hypothetical protein